MNMETPNFVLKYDENTQKKWKKIVTVSSDKYGLNRATVLANEWLKTQPVPQSHFIKRSAVSLTLVEGREGFIKRSADGQEYVHFVLNSTSEHKDGTYFSEGMLKKWAEYIKAHPELVGDVDHVLYDKLLNSDISNETAKVLLRNKKGIAKAVDAVYEKGKLWVKAIIDKRYRKIIEKAKGVSAEAYWTQKSGNVWEDGDLLGFSFNVHTTPADNFAGVVQ